MKEICSDSMEVSSSVYSIIVYSLNSSCLFTVDFQSSRYLVAIESSSKSSKE